MIWHRKLGHIGYLNPIENLKIFMKISKRINLTFDQLNKMKKVKGLKKGLKEMKKGLISKRY